MKFSLKYKARGIPKTSLQHEMLSKMKKAYAVVIYHKGEYPNGTPIGDVADLLENKGVKIKSKSRGRPRLKKWPFSKKVRARNYHRTWRIQVNQIADNIVRGNFMSYYQGFRHLGRRVVEQLQEEIYGMMKPELAASTIRRKGHSKPLIDTLRLVRSIQYKVVDVNDPSVRNSPFVPKWVTREFGSSKEESLSNMETDLLKMLYQHGLVNQEYAMRPYEEWKGDYATTMKALFSGRLEEKYMPSEKYLKALKDFIGHNWD